MFVYYKVFIQRVLYVTEQHDKVHCKMRNSTSSQKEETFMKNPYVVRCQKKKCCYTFKKRGISQKKKCTVIKITSEAGASKL